MEYILILYEKLLIDKVEKFIIDVYLMMMFCVYILQLFVFYGYLFVLCYRIFYMFVYFCYFLLLFSILGYQRVDVKFQIEILFLGLLFWFKLVGFLKRIVFMNSKIYVICIIEIYYLYMFFVRFYLNSFCISFLFVFQKIFLFNIEVNKLYLEL